MNNKNITFHWIRHAESCANVGQNDIQNSIKNLDLTNIIDKIIDTYTYHPNLSYKGMMQAINLNKFINEQTYDVIICSAMVRTCMTALLSLMNKPNTVIYVVPFINEVPSGLPIDVTNTALDTYSLKKNIIAIRKWLYDNKISDNALNNPIFDFSIMNNIMKNTHLDLTKESPENFFTYVMPEIRNLRNLIKKQDIKICAFSHGHFINKIVNHITKNNDYMKLDNTEVIEIDNNNKITTIYKPIYIENKSEINVCDGLKKFLYEINKNNQQELNNKHNNDINNNIQKMFIYSDKDIKELNDKTQIGGNNYKYKYMKYKMKYIKHT